MNTPGEPKEGSCNTLETLTESKREQAQSTPTSEIYEETSAGITGESSTGDADVLADRLSCWPDLSSPLTLAALPALPDLRNVQTSNANFDQLWYSDSFNDLFAEFSGREQQRVDENLEAAEQRLTYSFDREYGIYQPPQHSSPATPVLASQAETSDRVRHQSEPVPTQDESAIEQTSYGVSQDASALTISLDPNSIASASSVVGFMGAGPGSQTALAAQDSRQDPYSSDEISEGVCPSTTQAHQSAQNSATDPNALAGQLPGPEHISALAGLRSDSISQSISSACVQAGMNRLASGGSDRSDNAAYDSIAEQTALGMAVTGTQEAKGNDTNLGDRSDSPPDRNTTISISKQPFFMDHTIVGHTGRDRSQHSYSYPSVMRQSTQPWSGPRRIIITNLGVTQPVVGGAGLGFDAPLSPSFVQNQNPTTPTLQTDFGAYGQGRNIQTQPQNAYTGAHCASQHGQAQRQDLPTPTYQTSFGAYGTSQHGHGPFDHSPHCPHYSVQAPASHAHTHRQLSYPSSYPVPGAPQQAAFTLSGGNQQPGTNAGHQEYPAPRHSGRINPVPFQQDQFLPPLAPFLQGSLPNPSQTGQNVVTNSRQLTIDLLFNNLREARDHMENNFTPISDNTDGTIPQTDEAEQRSVRKILDAMMDMSQPNDNRPMIEQWIKLMRDTDKLVSAAWKLFERTLQAHRQEGPLVRGSRPRRAQSTFEERIDEECAALRDEKTICKHLLEPDYFDIFTDNPADAANRVGNNRKVNRGKKAAIANGRAAMNLRPDVRAREDSTVQDGSEQAEMNEYLRLREISEGMVMPQASSLVAPRPLDLPNQGMNADTPFPNTGTGLPRPSDPPAQAVGPGYGTDHARLAGQNNPANLMQNNVDDALALIMQMNESKPPSRRAAANRTATVKAEPKTSRKRKGGEESDDSFEPKSTTKYAPKKRQASLKESKNYPTVLHEEGVGFAIKRSDTRSNRARQTQSAMKQDPSATSATQSSVQAMPGISSQSNLQPHSYDSYTSTNAHMTSTSNIHGYIDRSLIPLENLPTSNPYNNALADPSLYRVGSHGQTYQYRDSTNAEGSVDGAFRSMGQSTYEAYALDPRLAGRDNNTRLVELTNDDEPALRTLRNMFSDYARQRKPPGQS